MTLEVSIIQETNKATIDIAIIIIITEGLKSMILEGLLIMSPNTAMSLNQITTTKALLELVMNVIRMILLYLLMTLGIRQTIKKECRRILEGKT